MIFNFMLLLFFSDHAQGRLLDKTAAVVNGDVITLSDSSYFKKNLKLRHELDPFLNFFAKGPETDQEIVNYLVQEVLIMQKLTPTKEETEEEINSIQNNNKIDRDKLKEVLKSQGVDFDDYYALMKVSIAKRHLMDRELRPLSQVSDEEVKNYYYTSPEFSEKNKVRKLSLSYGLNQIIIPTKELSDLIASRLKSGEDMQALSGQFKSSGADYVKLGLLSEDKLAPAVKDAIQDLKVGEFSKPIYTGSGYVILEVSEISAPKDINFEKDKEVIRNRLFQKTMTRHLEVWTEREKIQSYVYIP